MAPADSLRLRPRNACLPALHVCTRHHLVPISHPTVTRGAGAGLGWLEAATRASLSCRVALGSKRRGRPALRGQGRLPDPSGLSECRLREGRMRQGACESQQQSSRQSFRFSPRARLHRRRYASSEGVRGLDPWRANALEQPGCNPMHHGCSRNLMHRARPSPHQPPWCMGLQPGCSRALAVRGRWL